MRSPMLCLSLLTGAVLTVGLTRPVHAQSPPPNLVHFQARLADVVGTAMNGLVTVEVRAYSVPVGGIALWSESQVVTALNGVVNLNLGTLVALPSTLFDPASLDLAVKVGADPEMTPRRQNIAVPYARRSAMANGLEASSTIPVDLITSSHILDGTISNFSITNADIAPGVITGALLAPNAVESVHIVDGTIGTLDIYPGSVTSSLIANGTITTLDVANESILGVDIIDGTIFGSDIADGAIGTLDIADGSSIGVDIADGSITASDLATGSVTTAEILDGTITTTDIASNTIGASDIAPSAITSTGILDNTITATDIADTLQGTVNFDVTGNYAVNIVNTGTTGAGDGLRSTTSDSSGFAIWGNSTGASGGYGLYGTSTAGIGVVGTTSGATTGDRGVQGTALSGSSYAVCASGDFGGTGTKYFINPHPTDATKQVNFACLEGNESATFFRGSASLTGGLSLIPVPEVFALVTEPDSLMVTATPIGAPAVVYVESRSLDGIVIRGNADVKVDYMVTGTRLGHKGLQTIRDNHSFVPEWRGIPFGSQYKPAYRQLLVKNGILNPDFTPNEATAARNGWVLKDPWTDIRSEHLLRGLVKMGEIKNPRPFPSARSQTANAQPVVQDEKALEGGGK